MIPAFKQLFLTPTSKSNKTRRLMKLHGTGPNTFPMTIPEPASQAAIAAVKDAAVTSNIDSCPATACDVSEHCWPSQTKQKLDR